MPLGLTPPTEFLPPRRPIVLVVEGMLDIAFLTRLASVLHRVDPTLPDLGQHITMGSLVMVPIGGGDLAQWTHRLAALGCPEFHLYDRETEPETVRRQTTITAINARPNCHAALTRKRALENYLHPAVIAAVIGVHITVDDDRDVVATILQARNGPHQSRLSTAWRDQRRQVLRLKRVLNTQAVEQMTADLLAERDPEHELVGWLRKLGCHLSVYSLSRRRNHAAGHAVGPLCPGRLQRSVRRNVRTRRSPP